MKVSVSLPDEDVEFLDKYALSQGIGSRSAAVHKAVRLLRAAELGAAYEEAWADWDDSQALPDGECAQGPWRQAIRCHLDGWAGQ